MDKAEAKKAAIEEKAQRKRERINSDGSEEEASEDEDEEEEETESEPESDEPESEEESDFDADGIDISGDDSEYGSEEPSEPESGYGDESDPSSSGGEDREYTGNMFDKNPPVKFAAGPFEVLGQHNHHLETNDYCCISIWSTGGSLCRYNRLKDTTLRVPPLAND